MKILALEFSSPLRCAAVFAGNAVTGRACESKTRETKPIALITSALHEAGVRVEELDLIAVGIGPGSYAGIRIAISIAQGLHLAHGTKLVGISSADCVAHQLNQEEPASIIIDAQRDEFFIARYERVARQPNKRYGMRLIEPFRRMTDADWERQQAGERVYRMDVLENGPRWLAIPPDSAQLAHLAAEMFYQPVTHHPLEPIYLRKAEFVKAPPPRIIGNAS